MHYQGGPFECWPGWDRVYSGAAILRHLEHVQRYHLASGFDCTKPGDPWE
jgi:hypothetical protein